MLVEIACERIVPVFYNCMGQVCPNDGVVSQLDDTMHLDYVLFICHDANVPTRNVTSKTDGKQKNKLIINATLLLPSTIIFQQTKHQTQNTIAADKMTPGKQRQQVRIERTEDIK